MDERVLGGRYRIVRHLARGGMAEVYVAEDELLNRPVAVKVLFPELAHDDAFVERFRREARAAARLNHHNIVSVYDFGEDEGAWFIVMEYVEGRTLRDIIRAEGPMDPARAAELASEVAAALVAAHAQGIVHRDVKPANVLIAAGTGTVKVADFGIARAANARQGLTMPGTVLGTATYLSPEQAQGAEVDFRTDVYSLGMVLYEMLAGEPPFKGESPVAIAYQQLSKTAPPPSTLNPRVPPALDALVLKAMAKDPGARQQSAEQLREELLTVDRAVGDPDATAAILAPAAAADATSVIAGPSTSVLPPVAPTPPPRVERSTAGPVPPEVYRRRRAGVIAALALIALAIIAGLVLSRGGGNSNKQGTVAVPAVAGKTVADATKALDDAGLRAHVTERDSSGPAGQVAEQDPKAGTAVSKGSTVTLFVPLAPTTTSGRVVTTAPPATQATTTPPPTTAPPATTGTTSAPATTAAPPTSSIVVPTTAPPTTAR